MAESRYTRREFLRSAAAAGAVLVLPGGLVGCGRATGHMPDGTRLGTRARDGWDLVPEILARFGRPPSGTVTS